MPRTAVALEENLLKLREQAPFLPMTYTAAAVRLLPPKHTIIVSL